MLNQASATQSVDVKNFNTAGYDAHVQSSAQANVALQKARGTSADRLAKAVNDQSAAYMAAAVCVRVPTSRVGQPVTTCSPLVADFNEQTNRVLSMSRAILSGQ